MQGEAEERRERGETFSRPSKFGNASRRRRRQKKKRRAPSSVISCSLSPLAHLQVTEKQERIVDLHVKVVPASSLGHKKASSERRMEAFGVVVVKREEDDAPRGR